MRLGVHHGAEALGLELPQRLHELEAPGHSSNSREGNSNRLTPPC